MYVRTYVHTVWFWNAFVKLTLQSESENDSTSLLNNQTKSTTHKVLPRMPLVLAADWSLPAKTCQTGGGNIALLPRIKASLTVQVSTISFVLGKPQSTQDKHYTLCESSHTLALGVVWHIERVCTVQLKDCSLTLAS